MIDWRNKEAADYYVNQVIGLSTATDPHIDGVFVVSDAIFLPRRCPTPVGRRQDSGFPISGSHNLTYKSRKAMMLAELDAFKRICTLMAAHGKVVTVSLKSHFSNVSDDQGSVLCDPNMAEDNTTDCRALPDTLTRTAHTPPPPASTRAVVSPLLPRLGECRRCPQIRTARRRFLRYSARLVVSSRTDSTTYPPGTLATPATAARASPFHPPHGPSQARVSFQILWVCWGSDIFRRFGLRGWAPTSAAAVLLRLF